MRGGDCAPERRLYRAPGDISIGNSGPFLKEEPCRESATPWPAAGNLYAFSSGGPVNQELQSLFAGHIEEIRRRTERALEAAGLEEVLILAGSPPLQFADDQPYPFRPNPQFRLWVPEPEAGSVVSFRPGQRPRLLFVQTRDFWHQPPRLPAATWAQHFDVEVFHDEQALRDAVAPQGRRALLGARDPAWDGRGEWNPASLLGPLDYARAAKTPYEIECLARANLRGAAAHRAAERAFRDGASEYEVHLAYCRAASVREVMPSLP